MALSLYLGEYQSASTPPSARRIWKNGVRFTKADKISWHSPLIQAHSSWGPHLFQREGSGSSGIRFTKADRILWHSPFIQGNISLSPHLPQLSMIWLNGVRFTKADIILWHSPFIQRNISWCPHLHQRGGSGQGGARFQGWCYRCGRGVSAQKGNLDSCENNLVIERIHKLNKDLPV